MDAQLPDGLRLVRTTDVFDEVTLPDGLRRAHRVAAETWGRIVVHDGSLRLVFEDAPSSGQTATVGHPVTIPPGRPHHVEVHGPVRFAIEFHRP